MMVAGLGRIPPPPLYMYIVLAPGWSINHQPSLTQGRPKPGNVCDKFHNSKNESNNRADTYNDHSRNKNN